jgi:hypothetical protein
MNSWFSDSSLKEICEGEIIDRITWRPEWCSSSPTYKRSITQKTKES